MAGERLLLPESPIPSSITEAKQLGIRVSDGAKGRESNEEAGYLGRGGKLRFSRLSVFKKKPYDRPLPPGVLDRPLSSGRLGPTPSLPSRLVGSASNLITSSASYLFESFFSRRRNLWIGNGSRPTAGVDSADAEHQKDQVKEDMSPLKGPALVAHSAKVDGEDLDLAQVERILKQQFLSREDVKRLTDVLQNRPGGGNAVASNAEVHRGREMIKQVGEEPSPVQLAKAYMGKCTSRSISATPHWQINPDRNGEIAGSSSGSRIQEDASERRSAQASRANPAPAAASMRMLKRRLIADDEDDVIFRGPIRRVRQKMTIMANASPYIRQVTAATGPLRAPSTPLLQPSEMIEKVVEALEEPKLHSKGKSVEDPMILAGPSHNEDPPESSKARENVENYSSKEFSVLPTAGEPGISSCKPARKPVVTTAPKTAEKSVTGSIVTESPNIIPERTKGFHMSAFFEDSSSDEEEAAPLVKAMTSSEAQHAGQSIFKEATRKQPSAFILNDEAADSLKRSSSRLLQPDVAAGPSNTESSSLPTASSSPTYLSNSPSAVASTLTVENSSPLLPNMKPFPVVSHVPSATEKVSPPLTATSASTMAPSFVTLATSPIPAPPSILTPLPAAAVSLPVLEAAAVAVAPLSSAIAVEPLSVMQKVAAAAGVGAEASGTSPTIASQPLFQPPAPATSLAEAPSNVSLSFTALAAAPKLPAALETSAASLSPVGSVASLAPTFSVPSAAPIVVEAGMGGAQPDSATAANSFLKAGIRGMSASDSPSADRQAEQDTMATDPMTEEPEGSIMCSSAPAFVFASASTAASTTMGQTLPFGFGAASTPFSFPSQSSTPSGVSSSVQFPFSSQSSSATGQLFTFGASGSSPANPFSASVKSSFSFGSSAATSASPIFTATSSAPISFPATPAAPSPFPFGAHAASSSLTNSTSVFGAQTPPTASAFAGTEVKNNAPAFLFSVPPTSSGTPTAPSFQFGGAGAGVSSMSSSPSFGGQSFAFGGQPTVAAANPFAQSGASNATPFQFGSSAATSSQPVFSNGANTTSSFSFGPQPAASPSPFAFGGQTGASPTGQPFGFGGQPAAPVQSLFTLPGATGQSAFASAGASGMDFAGGFSLGAAGGEKSGRKFIKAKRIAKRGK
eukprot:c25036_g1_i1 orf=1073-4492(-)